ncbi:MAG: molybdopterin-binding protein [Gammaproteobacteria bacterium]
MRIGLYVIGDELLSGKRQDKHLANVAELLKTRGLQLSWVKFLGDELELLVNEFRSSLSSTDLVFSCGGIGATPDDLTRHAVADALGIQLELHAEGLQILESIAENFDGGLTEQRKRMVEFPIGASLIPNPINKIPGFSIHNHYFVPGFPKMAQPMIQWVLENHYANLSNDDYLEWSVKLFEVPESHIADLMETMQQSYAVKAFSLPKLFDDGYQLELGLKGKHQDVSEASEDLMKNLKQRGYDFEKI